jgi:hypothetical protein
MMGNFMRTPALLAAALAAAAVSLPAFAADATPLSPADSAWHATASANRLQLVPRRAAAPGAEVGAQPKVMGNDVYPGTPMANGFRAYPPSCAADPLPDKASGPTWSGSVPLYAGTSSGASYTEPVIVTVWRLSCSSSGSAVPYNPEGFDNAITLMRIDRTSDNEGKRDHWPYLPLIQAAQGSISDFANDPKTLIRVAVEPNTVVSEMSYGTPLYDSTTFVLENYPYEGSGYFTFSDAFKLRVNPLLRNVNPLELQIPDYAPTEATYPDAFAYLPIDGYAAAQWNNSEFNEGLLLQVAEAYDPQHPYRRMLIFDLLTADTNGQPIWLVGAAAFDPSPAGVTSLDVNLSYLGQEQASGFKQFPWGKATINLASCNELLVTYSPNANVPEPVPVFEGTTPYERIFSANGMLCE